MAYRVHVAPAPVTEYDVPAPTVAYQAHAAPSPEVEYDAPALTATYWVHAAPAPVDEYDAPAARVAPSPLVDVPVVQVVQVPQVQVVEKTIETPQLQIFEKIVEITEIQTVQCTRTSECLDIITPAPMEFVEAALHEIDEELCRDDLEEICYVTRMSRKRIWRCVWHGRSTPSDASKSERSWRRLSKCLCYQEEFDEMKRTCAYCGMFEDEDDILVRCQGPDCSLRSADYE